MNLSFGHRIQAKRATKGQRTCNSSPASTFSRRPRYRSATSTTPETEPATRSVPSRSFHPPTHARIPLSPTRLSSHRFSPALPSHSLDLLSPSASPYSSYDTLIIPNIDGSTCFPTRRSSPVCNGRIRRHLPGQADSPSPTPAAQSAE